MTTLTVGCINIPTGAGQENWERAFVAMIARARVFGVNEVFHPKAQALYRDLAEADYYGHFGLNSSPNPIFWDKEGYHLIDSEVIQLHGRGPKYAQWPGFNECRYATRITLRPRGCSADDGLDFDVINTHLVPNGNKVPSLWRAMVRSKSKKILRQMIAAATRRGRPCALVGDMNISEPFSLGPRFAWVRGRGIDKVGLGLPRGVERGKDSFTEFPAPIDHKRGIAAVLRWGR